MFVYILLGLVVIIGIIFICYGMTRKNHEEGGALAVYSNDVEPKMPNSFDIPFIEKQIQIIQNSPSMVENYFIRLRAKFNLEQHMEILDQMEKFNQVVAKGIKSRTEILAAETERQIAEGELNLVGETINVNKLRKQAEAAQLRDIINNSGNGPVSVKEGKGLSERLETKRAKDNTYTQHDIRSRFEKEQVIDDEIDREIARRSKSIFNGKKLTDLSPEEMKEMEIMYAEMEDRRITEKARI